MLTQDTAQATIAILRAPRYEVMPAGQIVDQLPELPRSVRLTVTCSPDKGLSPTIETAESLSELGYEAVPHISARMVSSREHLAEIVKRLRRASVRNIYVIGGDAANPLGPYPGALSLLHALQELGHPFAEIGIAAYPEGHPLIEASDLWRILWAKQPLVTYMVTQMCFDATAISQWIAEARQKGVHLPAIVGIPGVASRKHLLRMASKVGVGESARFLSKHTGMISRLVRPGPFTPDDLIDGLSPAVSDSALDIRGIHVYTFNNVAQTEEWRQRRLSWANRR